MNGIDKPSFDYRIVDRLIEGGIVKKEDYDKFLKTLPDLRDDCHQGEEERDAATKGGRK